MIDVIITVTYRGRGRSHAHEAPSLAVAIAQVAVWPRSIPLASVRAALGAR